MRRGRNRAISGRLDRPHAFAMIVDVTTPSERSNNATRSAPRDYFRAAVKAGVRRRFSPYQLRRAHAIEMARESGPLP